MKKQSNRELIDEMKLMLEDKPKLTLESFVMPHMEENEEEHYEEEPSEEGVDVMNEPEEMVADNCGIEKELTQIRKIALSAINKLADRPTSNQYKVMKQIWNQVDRATESSDEGNAE